MNFQLAFMQGIYGFVVSAGYVLAAIGVLFVVGLLAEGIAKLFGANKGDDDE